MQPHSKLAALILSLAIGPLAACELTSPLNAPDLDSPAMSRSHTPDHAFAPHGVALPLRVMAFTDLESLTPDPRCGEPPRLLNIQVGEGQGTHLGRFDIRFEFCVDITDLLDDGQLTEGESIPYDNGIGIIVAANGDELHLTIEGAVLPSDDPSYDFEFQDPFEFVGGTGRFAGAGGSGTTDSHVDQETNRTDHLLSGTLVLRPGAPR